MPQAVRQYLLRNALQIPLQFVKPPRARFQVAQNQQFPFSADQRYSSCHRINQFPAGASVPFVHSHKNNEEIYGILSGKGKAVVDGEEITLSAGDWLKIAPAAKRQFFAAVDEGIAYVCIQVKENSLGVFTENDAVVY